MSGAPQARSRRNLGLCVYLNETSTLGNPGSISMNMHCRWSSAVHCFRGCTAPFMLKLGIPSTPALRAFARHDNQRYFRRLIRSPRFSLVHGKRDNRLRPHCPVLRTSAWNDKQLVLTLRALRVLARVKAHCKNHMPHARSSHEASFLLQIDLRHPPS